MNEDDEDKKTTGAGEPVDDAGAGNATGTKKLTFDELLANNKDYQSEYDKKVTTAMSSRLEKERQKWELEQKNKLEEAEKLAKMDEDQKKDYELARWKQRAEKAEKQNAVDNLRNETIKQANEKGISLELVSTLNFEYETAETIKSKLDLLEKAGKSIREKAIDEYSREKAPQTGDKVDTTETPKTYEEWDKYYKEHPNAK